MNNVYISLHKHMKHTQREFCVCVTYTYIHTYTHEYRDSDFLCATTMSFAYVMLGLHNLKCSCSNIIHNVLLSTLCQKTLLLLNKHSLFQGVCVQDYRTVLQTFENTVYMCTSITALVFLVYFNMELPTQQTRCHVYHVYFSVINFWGVGR